MALWKLTYDVKYIVFPVAMYPYVLLILSTFSLSYLQVDKSDDCSRQTRLINVLHNTISGVKATSFPEISLSTSQSLSLFMFKTNTYMSHMPYVDILSANHFS